MRETSTSAWNWPAAIVLPVVDSRIMHFGDEVAIVVERCEPIRTAAGLRRVHQEDICQAPAFSRPINTRMRAATNQKSLGIIPREFVDDFYIANGKILSGCRLLGCRSPRAGGLE
jgi:hypothetical protein